VRSRGFRHHHAVGQGRDIDRIIASKCADDYLPKPFTRVSCWRASVRCCAGRAARFPAAVGDCPTGAFRTFSVQISTPASSSRDGAEITLTGGEYELLEIFVTHANRALSRRW